MLKIIQAEQGTPPSGAVSAPGASKERTTSAFQPPSRLARLRITVYANLFGSGLLIVFLASAAAMLTHLAHVTDARSVVWWQIHRLPPWHLMALIVCSLPYILAFCAVNLYRWSAFSRYDFRLLWQRRSANLSLSDERWQALAERAEQVWNYEAQRFSESRRMASLSSLTLFICTMILARYLAGESDASRSPRSLIAIAVGTAIAFAFANDLGRILFRVALRDAGAEIFSFATKNSILVAASTLLFSTLLCSGLAQLNDAGVGDGAGGKPIPLGVPGFIVIGATIAIIGGRAVRLVSDRAASALGLPASRAAETSDLTQLEGLGEEDIARLAEEGVDSLHALAFIPLPRLLFNTKYGLERLCDWQDQALLLTHFGLAKARLLRDHMLVRGAIAAQDAAQAFFSGVPPRRAEQADAAASESVRDKLANLLGFATDAQATFALNQLADDEVVNRLRVYATAAHSLEWSDGERSS